MLHLGQCPRRSRITGFRDGYLFAR